MADSASIRIRIGASVDASVERAFSGIEKRAQKAQVAVQRGQRQTTSSATSEARKQIREQENLARAAASLDRQRSRALFQQHRERERAADRAVKAEERSQQRIRRQIEMTARAAERAQERQRRAAERSSRRQAESFARRTSHRTTRFFWPDAPITSVASRAFGGVASGVGVDTSIAGMFSRNVGLETMATQLSASGFQAGGEGANARRVDPRELVAQARQISGQFGVDPGQAIDALAQFQKIAGDLETGRQSLENMARLATATGSDFGEMAAAYANVANGLGDVENKAAATEAVMRTIAGQGKLGAVEIADMAVQMARVAASANAFSGDRALNIQKMGALVQIARAEGGAPSAAEAARSAGGFANTLKKSARISEFRKQGIDVFADESKTKLKDPIQIIKEALAATGGNLQKMNKLFMDVVGARTVEGLAKDFTAAGGGEAGLAAVDAKIDRMLKAQLQQEEIDESAKRASETTAARAARFQNQLDLIADRTATKLLPALEKAGPSLLKFAEVLGSVATWTAENPKTAIAAGLGASFARAGVESLLRAQIEKAILGQAAAGTAAKSLAGKLGVVGAALATLTASFTATKGVIDELFEADQERQSREASVSIAATNAGSSAVAQARLADRLERQGDHEGARAARQRAGAAAMAGIESEQQNIRNVKDRDSLGRSVLDWLMLPSNEREDIQRARTNRETAEVARSKQEIGELKALLSSINEKLGGELRVSSTPVRADGRASQ